METKHHYKVMIIDSDETHLRLMERAILKRLQGASLHLFQDTNLFFDALYNIMPDIIIVDYLLPGLNGIDFLKALTAKNLDIPIITTTVHADKTIAVQALKHGAWDHLVKSADFFDILPGIIKAVVHEQRLKKPLRKTASWFYSMPDKMFNWLWEVDARGVFTYSNHAVETILGYHPDEITGQYYLDFFYDEDKEGIKQKFHEIKKEGETLLAFEHRLIHKKGYDRIVEANVIPFFDKRKNFLGFRGIHRDITDRKQTEEALRNSEKRYRSLIDDVLDSSAIGILILNSDYRIAWVNRALESYFGIEGEELTGKDQRKFIHDQIGQIFEDPETFVKKVSATYDNNTYTEDFQCRVLPEGKRKERRLRHHSQPIRSGIYAGGRIEHYSDITERVLAKEELEKIKAEQAVLLDMVPAMIFWVDKKGYFIRVNKAFSDFFHTSPDKISGKSYFDLFPEDIAKMFQNDNLKIIKTGFPLKQVEEQIPTPDGIMWVSTDKIPYKDEQGNTIGIVGFSVDITKRKKAEAYILRLSQQLLKVQEIERQRLSHDLHDHLAQDLSVIKIGCETLFDNFPETPAEIKLKVSELSRILEGCIMAVRDLAYGLRPPALDQLGLVQTLFQYCEEVTEKNAVKVEFHAAGMENLRLNFNAEINIYRIVQEGINNIKKHSDATHATIRLVLSHPDIILRIEDNGRGFDIKLRLPEAINEKHMGIQSMKERVSLLHGIMTIKSRPDEGVKILIEIPYKENLSDSTKECLDNR